MENLRQVIIFMKKKVNLGFLRVNPSISKGVPQACLDPNDDILSLLMYDFIFFQIHLFLHKTYDLS
jgi:hypothetical protein